MALSEEEWRLLIRRALDIPDAVSEVTAIEVVTDTVYKPAPGANRGKDRELEEAIGKVIFEQTALAGADGSLDRFIMDRESAVQGRTSASIDAADSLICSRAEEASGFKQKGAFLPGSTEPLLEQLKSFILTHRFQSDRWPRSGEA